MEEGLLHEQPEKGASRGVAALAFGLGLLAGAGGVMHFMSAGEKAGAVPALRAEELVSTVNTTAGTKQCRSRCEKDSECEGAGKCTWCMYHKKEAMPFPDHKECASGP